MTTPESHDLAWQQALDWLLRQQEQGLDESACKELLAWLEAAPQHKQAYQQAQRLWLLTGLIPASE